MGLEHVYAQIWPDEEVFTGESQRHEPLHDVRRWAYHLARHRDHGDLDLTDAEVDAMTDTSLREIATTPRTCETPKKNEDGTLVGRSAATVTTRITKKGKYIHPPGPMETIEHDHAVDFADWKDVLRVVPVELDGRDVSANSIAHACLRLAWRCAAMRSRLLKP